MRLFPRAVLEILTTITRRPSPGTVVDIASLTSKDLHRSVVSGNISKCEAIMEISSKINSLSWEESDSNSSSARLKGFEAVLAVLKALPDTPITRGNSLDGAYMYVLSRLSHVMCGQSSVSFDLCVELDEDATNPNYSSSSMGSGNKSFSASLMRPKSFEQVASLLNFFNLVLVATGLSSVLALAPFLDDVVYEPVRTGDLPWPVAFELLIIYLRMIENEPGVYNLVNVVSKCGGMDAKRESARQVAAGFYPKGLFRPLPGERRSLWEGGHFSHCGTVN